MAVDTLPDLRSPSRLPKSHWLLWLIVGIFICRLILGASTIPPWQSPDEPTHFGYVSTLATGPGFESRADEEARLEAAILQSMAQSNWWRQYEESTPDPVPTRFAQVSDHVTPIGGGAQPTYYVLAAGYLKVLGVDGLGLQYGAVRALSMMFAVLTIIAGWAGARLLFGDANALVIAAVMALHPQFLIVSLTVGPDAFVNLVGAVIWWQAARLVRDRKPLLALGAMLGCAGLLVFTKRHGTPVAAAAIALASLYAVREARHRRVRTAWVGAAVVLVPMAAVAIALWWFPAEYERLKYSWGLFLREPAAWNARAWSVGYFVEYTSILLNSAWLVAGYLRYSAPVPWLVVTYLLMAVAVAGVLRAVSSLERRRRDPGTLLAIALVAVQVGALYATTYTLAYGAQGRYLFPVFCALSSLLWIGFREFWPVGTHRYAATTLIAVMFALDVSGWFTVLFPAYLY